MEANYILTRLKELFTKIPLSNPNGNTYNTALEIRLIIIKAVYLIDLYPAKNNTSIEIGKERAKNLLQEAIGITTNFFDVYKGYNVQEKRNSKIEDYEFINPASAGLEYFIIVVEGQNE
ncbi:MAG: hypothetical protein ACO1OF_16265 [Adhaeribacter sp.]